MALSVAVIGTGNIGGTLGRAFAAAGHRVTFGARRPQPEATPPVAEVGTAIADAQVVLLAVPGSAVADVVDQHADALAGKLVVDAANSIGGDGPAHHHDLVLKAAPTARYARAFNTLGWENFADPRFGEQTADLFFSSSSEDRATVEELVTAVGLRPVFVGDGQQDVVDGVLRLWFALAVGQQRGRHLAFRVLDATDR